MIKEIGDNSSDLKSLRTEKVPPPMNEKGLQLNTFHKIKDKEITVKTVYKVTIKGQSDSQWTSINNTGCLKFLQQSFRSSERKKCIINLKFCI